MLHKQRGTPRSASYTWRWFTLQGTREDKSNDAGGCVGYGYTAQAADKLVPTEMPGSDHPNKGYLRAPTPWQRRALGKALVVL